MSFDAEKLYGLLPAVYRQRDVEQGEPLKALISVMAEQVAVLEEDLAQLYDDQFIETCAEWVVPYIGDLVGTRGLFSWPDATFSNRAQVANTLAYRRRKGTASVLEQLARDVTGWDANVVEFFQLLATTEYMKHLRPTHLATPDLRRWEDLERIGTPFDRVSHTADVRHIESGRGLYNIPNIGIFLWRLGSQSLTDSPAYKLDERRYRFNSLGFDAPLYNLPETEDEITHLATNINVPAPLSRRLLDRDKDFYYGADRSLSLTVNDVLIPADEIVICDLSEDDWTRPLTGRDAIDPVLGRILLREGLNANADVRVMFHYGFSAEMGGGEYGRASSFTDGLKPLIKVPNDEAKIQDALNTLTESAGAVEIENNDYCFESPYIHAPAGKMIELRAADERRPVIVPSSDLWITGDDGAVVILNGLVISGGSLRLPTDRFGLKNELRVLRLVHCTLLPGASLAIGDVPAMPATPRIICDAPDVTIEIERCIVGAITAVDGARVRITNSIVDATSETEFAYAGTNNGIGAPLEVENSTIIGRVRTVMIEASNTIFLSRIAEGETDTAPVEVERLQEGCVRFSYVPPASRVPRQYECQPQKGDSQQEMSRLRPVFTSTRYGDAAYGQLSARCAVEIRQGADDEAEMGAFHHLYQPQREANLRTRLDEYLRFGLEAGIFYAS